MEGQEFVDYFISYWGVTVAELAELVGKSKDSVYHWAVSDAAKSKRTPPSDIVKQLKFIHYIWLQWQVEAEQLPCHIRLIYEQAKDRQEFKRSAAEPIDEDSEADA